MRAAKLKLPEHLEAFRQNRCLVREVSAVDCDSDTLQRVVCYYPLVKHILRYVPWQERLLCARVSATWRLAVEALRKERIDLHLVRLVKVDQLPVPLKLKSNAFSEPMVVVAFCKFQGFNLGGTTYACNDIEPCPCVPPCGQRHLFMDILQFQFCGPKNCMLSVWLNSNHSDIFAIPAIPGVEFRVINVRYTELQHRKDALNHFYREIDRLARTSIYKGALVFEAVAGHGNIITSSFASSYLKYLKDVQPNIPYAIAGCYVGNVLSEPSDIDGMVDRRNRLEICVQEDSFVLSCGLFCVPKNVSERESSNKCNIEMFSLVLKDEYVQDENTVIYSKVNHENAIIEFANKVPRFDHSVAIDMSDQESEPFYIKERERFRTLFPSTPLVACHSYNVMGVNHPARPVAAVQEQGVLFYGMVIVYIGWGKKMAPAAPAAPAAQPSYVQVQ